MKITKLIIVAAIGLGLLTVGCSKVNFSPALTAGPVDNNGNGTLGNGGPEIAVGTSPSPGTDTGASPSPTATATPTATPMPSPSASPVVTDASPTPSPTTTTSGDQLCILLNAGNNGVDHRVGLDVAVEQLVDQHGMVNAVCMSTFACMTLVNNYLNETGGVFGGAVGPLPASKAIYVEQKFAPVCAHNPNVAHLTDTQVLTELQKLGYH